MGAQGIFIGLYDPYILEHIGCYGINIIVKIFFYVIIKSEHSSSSFFCSKSKGRKRPNSLKQLLLNFSHFFSIFFCLTGVKILFYKHTIEAHLSNIYQMWRVFVLFWGDRSNDGIVFRRANIIIWPLDKRDTYTSDGVGCKRKFGKCHMSYKNGLRNQPTKFDFCTFELVFFSWTGCQAGIVAG